MANSPSSSDAHNDTSPYMPYGATGGGGGGGQYLFTDLPELDSITTALATEIEDVRNDDRYFREAIRLATPPADDQMSRGQVEAYKAALQEGWDHNKAVLAYMENEHAKLQAARQAYAETDTGSAETLGNIDKDDQ